MRVAFLVLLLANLLVMSSQQSTDELQAPTPTDHRPNKELHAAIAAAIAEAAHSLQEGQGSTSGDSHGTGDGAPPAADQSERGWEELARKAKQRVLTAEASSPSSYSYSYGDGSCQNYELLMEDSFGDGWKYGGNFLSIVNFFTGETVYSGLTVKNGYSAIETVCLPLDTCFKVTVTSGGGEYHDSDVSWSLNGVHGAVGTFDMCTYNLSDGHSKGGYSYSFSYEFANSPPMPDTPAPTPVPTPPSMGVQCVDCGRRLTGRTLLFGYLNCC